jgi:uncharacterized protein (UPF0276 family)
MIPTLPVSHLITHETAAQVPGVGALEYRDVDRSIGYDLPALLHSGLGIVQGSFLDWFESAAAWINSMPCDLFSFDCGPAVGSPRLDGHQYVCDESPMSRVGLKCLIAERLTRIRELVDTPLAVENLNYFPTDAYRHVCEAGFIDEIVHENDVGLVLDVAHAIITANNTGQDINEYVHALPLDRVRAVHLSAPGMQGGQWRDLHAAPTSREYAILDGLLPSLPSDVFGVIEHYDSLDAVIACYAELTRFLDERTLRHDRACGPTRL